MSNKAWSAIVILLALVIAVLVYFLFATPVPDTGSKTSHTASSTQTSTAKAATSSSKGPLDTQVVVTSPKKDATVSHQFSISGTAPSGWYFEAVFPIQVRDPDDNLIGTAQGRAQSDWMAAGPIPFKATVSVDATYHGPANLILLKDNPSGNPETMDSVTIPITVQ